MRRRKIKYRSTQREKRKRRKRRRNRSKRDKTDDDDEDDNQYNDDDTERERERYGGEREKKSDFKKYKFHKALHTTIIAQQKHKQKHTQLPTSNYPPSTTPQT